MTGRIFTMDTGADGSVLIDQIERTPELTLLSGGHVRKLLASALTGPVLNFTVLGDGRAIWVQAIGGRNRLITILPGGEPEPLLSTSEPTATPAIQLGAGDLAFLLGAPGKEEIGIASLATGRIVRRIPFDKGEISAMTATPDGRTLYCVAGHSVWAVPTLEDRPAVRRICDGDGVAADPNGEYLAVAVQKNLVTTLYRVPLHGGVPEEINIQGHLQITRHLGTRALSRDGRLLNGIATPGSWFYQPAIIDMKTGNVTFIPTDSQGDQYAMNWTQDGQVMAIVSPLRSGIWKLTPSLR